MYIKSVNDDEQLYEFLGLWASHILSLPRELTFSAHKLQKKLQV